MGMTWGLVVFMLTQVVEEMRAGGWYQCHWEISRMEDGQPGRFLGRGRMWPSLVLAQANGTTA